MKNIQVLNIEKFLSSENQKEFYVSDLKTHIEINKSFITHPHKHNSYLCVLFTKGFGTHEIDFTSYEINEGSLFLIAPGQTHHWTLSNDIDGYIFTHTQAFYDFHYTKERISQFPFFQSIHNNPHLNLKVSDVKTIVNFFELISFEYQSQQLLKSQMILNYISIIYSVLSRIYISESKNLIQNSSKYIEKYHQFEQLIEKQFLIEKSPSKYADLLNISSKHLNRITKSSINKTASELISERIILEAKRKIVHSKVSLSEIAYSLGYDDYAYFSRLFKQKEGISPAEFLKKYSSQVVK
ncbi:helix-turn-helix domain-containing protein [Flavobacterium sp. SM2513]|uniref:helix-turn-helix domain-containing protein n=1 Tax=Flavobacterium sp. SM2513 TaxID=3424766 RepID=UPI003D7F5149